MSASDTPRTDALVFSQVGGYFSASASDYRELSRQLERELTAANAKLESVTALLRDHIANARTRDAGLSESDLRPFVVQLLGEEISQSRFIEIVRERAEATVDKLTEAATARADLWRARCKEAQRVMRKTECKYVTTVDWDSARDAGKDE